MKEINLILSISRKVLLVVSKELRSVRLSVRKNLEHFKSLEHQFELRRHGATVHFRSMMN